NLSHANLRRATFWLTDLTNTTFHNAELLDARFIAVVFNGTDFSKAVVGATVFANCDFREARGLDLIDHWGPSEISVRTIYRSRGDIPFTFLRGAGLPDNFITYMHSLTGKAFEFYSCFISYSSRNHTFAERLYADLQSKGVRCWFAPQDLRIGEKTRLAIDESIRKHEKLLLILSKDSVTSDWVEKEVETAMEAERRQGRTILFPVRIDDAVMKIDSGWPADIRRTRNIGDFRRWKNHETYKRAFDRLLRDLKADLTIPGRT